MNKIDALTGIRAFAAIWVIFYHCMGDGQSVLDSKWVDNFAQRGGSAVDLFFVLSGFIMAFVYGNMMSTFSSGKMRRFLWRRFSRIYPAHLTVLLLFLAVVILAIVTDAPYTKEFHTAPKFFYQLFMLNGLGIPDSNGWNFPSWTISSEFFAYLIFPFLIVWTTRLNNVQSIIAIIIIYFTMFGLALWITNCESYYLPWSLVLSRIGSQFTVGCLLYNLQSAPSIKKVAAWLAPLTFLLVIAVSTLFSHDILIGIVSILYAILILALANDQASLFSRILRSRTIVFLGDISYSMYIVHNFTLIILNQAANRIPFLSENFIHGTFIRFLADLVLATFGGAILHFGIEVPARRWLTSPVAGFRFWRKQLP